MKKFNTLKIRRERSEEFYRGHDAYMEAAKRDFSAMAPKPRHSVAGYLSDEYLRSISSSQQGAAQSFGGGL